MLGTAHQLNTAHLVLACYDNTVPAANAIAPSSWTVNQTTYDVIVKFAIAQSGYCVLNGTGPAVYSASESGTTWSIPAATHNLGVNLQVATYDSSGNRIEPGSVIVDGSGNVTVLWSVAQTGKAVITQ